MRASPWGSQRRVSPAQSSLLLLPSPLHTLESSLLTRRERAYRSLLGQRLGGAATFNALAAWTWTPGRPWDAQAHAKSGIDEGAGVCISPGQSVMGEGLGPGDRRGVATTPQVLGENQWFVEFSRPPSTTSPSSHHLLVEWARRARRGVDGGAALVDSTIREGLPSSCSLPSPCRIREGGMVQATCQVIRAGGGGGCPLPVHPFDPDPPPAAPPRSPLASASPQGG